MSVFSSTKTTTFVSWCRYFLIISALFIGSSVSGFTATSVGEKINYYYYHHSNRDQHKRPRLRYNNSDRSSRAFQQKQHPASAATSLRLSFSAELPVASDLISTYAYCLKYHYFPTQSITNGVLTVVGDGVAQTQEENERQANSDSIDSGITNRHYYDPKRGLVYFFKGLGSGIMWAWWFDMAEVWSMELTQSVLSYGSNGFEEAATTASSDVLSTQGQTIRTGINIFLEQFLVCPILYSLWDIPVTSLMRDSTLRRIPDQIQEKLFPLLVANAKVWTLVNVVTYNIPLEYRLLFTSAASIVSESINSGITSKQVAVPETTTPTPTHSPALPLANPIAELGIDSTLPSTAAVAMAAAVVPLINSSKNMTIFEF